MFISQLFESKLNENAEELNIGDPVIIIGDVQFKGKTGEIAEFGKDKRFVIVDLYNHGRHSFHSSDVEFNDYADSEEEANDWQERGLGEDAEFGSNYAEQLAQQVFDTNPNLNATGRADEVLDAGYAIARTELGSRVRGVFHDEDFPSDFVSAYAWLQKQGSLNEFAIDDGGSGDEEPFFKFAKMWYSAPDVETQRKVEQVLAKAGWEIGEIESEEGGAFIVQAGDEDGGSYMGWSEEQLAGLEETKVSKYKDLGATKDTTHFIKNVTTGEIMSPHRGKQDAEDALVSYYRGPSDGNEYKIVRARKEGVGESELNQLDPVGDLKAKRKALQDIQMDPHTGKDPELTAELMRRKAALEKEAKRLGLA